MTTGVTGFLASGTDAELESFHLAVCMALLAQERRDQTIYYTAMMEDRDMAINAADESGVTLQEMDDGPGERWTVVVNGEHPGWSPGGGS